eukprot:2915917-Prymnesium_polylepis.2
MAHSDSSESRGLRYECAHSVVQCSPVVPMPAPCRSWSAVATALCATHGTRCRLQVACSLGTSCRAVPAWCPGAPQRETAQRVGQGRVQSAD